MMGTFSIVARCQAAGDLGIAVHSKFLAVGAVVPWARAGVGAIATQSYANTSYGPEGLRLLAQGLSAQDALARLLDGDQEAELRQVGIVDQHGGSSSHSGDGCFPWAGGVHGFNYACQGNILVGEETVEAMAITFEAAQGPLAERLLSALAAGQEAGGDRRGQQSAALLVVREGGGYGGFNDRFLDLRVDDHLQPIAELQRLLDLHELYFGVTSEKDLLPLDAALTLELQSMLQDLGFYAGHADGVFDETSRQSLREWAGIENLEERLDVEARIDPVLLGFLRRQWRASERQN